MSAQSLRLFFALNMGRSARSELVRLQSRMWGEDARGRTRPENLHLTLACLGNTDPARLGDLQQIVDQLEVPVLSLYFDRIGVFHQASGDIWWLGMGDNHELQNLQAQLTKELGKAGFPVEERKFVPHLTLARRTRPKWLLKEEKLPHPISVKVGRVSLMRSQQINGKTVYTEVMSTGRT